MTKQETIKRLCKIVYTVYHSINNYTDPCDCFCGEVEPIGNYQNSGKIIDYIKTAVIEKLKRDGYELKE